MAVKEHASTPDPRQVARLHASALRRLPFLKGRLTVESFAAGITRSVAHRFRDDRPEPKAIADYVDSLRGEDLALAVACQAGDERAWEHVVTTYRPILYRAASVLTADDTAGRELADSLWSELYGVGRTRASMESGGSVRSLLSYYHGRAQLSTWLRSVLAQRHVDLARTRRRFQPLGSESAETADASGEASRASLPTGNDAPNTPDDEPDRGRYVAACRHALQAALRDLNAGDRLRLSCYYVQGLKLAEIGRLFGEHEATVSRKLSRARKQVRANVERVLSDRHRLTPAQIELCYQYIVEESPVDLSDILESDD